MTNLINFTVSLTAASEFVRGGEMGGGVRGAGVVGSLVCEPTYCLNCCHTRLVCNKGQVRHSGRNLFCPTAFFFSIKQKSLFWQPGACSFGAVRAFALRRCTLRVVSALRLFTTLFFFLSPLFQAGRSSASPSPAPC